tara:strand:- start:2331 stop:2648 length:318 start_codon:yes stop_codon:yes gene_type:complete
MEKGKDFKSWYGGWSNKLRLNPDPYHWKHFYDYESAYNDGADPTWDDGKQMYKWPSKYKDDFHPDRFVFEKGKWLDSKYDKNVSFPSVMAWEEKRENMLLERVNR